MREGVPRLSRSSVPDEDVKRMSMYRTLRKTTGRLWWRGRELFQELFIENSDQKKLERAIRRLQDVAHQRPLDPQGKRIVFFSLRPWITYLAHEGVLAARLRHAGHHVSYYTCHYDLAFCMRHNVNRPEQDRLCLKECVWFKNKWMDARYEQHTLGPLSDEAQAACEQIDEMPWPACLVFSWRGLDLGKICRPTVQWYVRRTRFTEEDAGIWRTFLKSAVHVADRFDAFLIQARPDVVVCFSGTMFAERVAQLLCRRHGIRSVSYGISYYELCLVGHNQSVWESLYRDRDNLDAMRIPDDALRQARKRLGEWTRSGGYNGYLLWRRNKREARQRARQLTDDPRPFAVAFTNTTYETAILPTQRLFRDQFEWTALLVDYFRRHPEYRLIIRVHPAETLRDEFQVREWYLERIHDYVKDWPGNVRVVPPESATCSYELALRARVALTYVSTIGMELVWRGIPVITAGSVHYDHQGFTCDPETEADYLRELDRHMSQKQPVTEQQKRALLRYIAWFMFIRMVRFEPIEQGRRETYLRCRDIQPRKVFSGRLPGLEAICALILDGREWWRVAEVNRGL